MLEPRETAILNTYRYLRLATFPLLLTLLIAVALESVRGQPCLLGSISAYFHTPARGAFIGGLFAVGACLIVYKGNDPLEDVLLDFSGFMAFVVALVPTVVDRSCGAKYPAQTLDLTAEAVRNNITTLLIATALAAGAKWWLVRKDRRRQPAADDLELPMEPDIHAAPLPDGAVVQWARWASRGCLVILGVELGLFVFLPNVFKDVSHGVAAVTMVAGVIGVMIANARGLARVQHGPHEPGMRKWVNGYSLVATTMVVLIGLAAVAHIAGITSGHTILIVEVVVIVCFLAFWAIQTAELWDYPTRQHKAAAEAAGEHPAIVPFGRSPGSESRGQRAPGP